MPNATVRANAQAMPIDRRSMFGGLAAAGALLLAPRARAATRRGGDPIFDAMERHRAAAAALDAYDGDDELTYLRLDSAERNAMFELADTVPTAHKGAHAALRYLVREAGDRHYKVLGIFGASLIEAKWGSFGTEA